MLVRRIAPGAPSSRLRGGRNRQIAGLDQFYSQRGGRMHGPRSGVYSDCERSCGSVGGGLCSAARGLTTRSACHERDRQAKEESNQKEGTQAFAIATPDQQHPRETEHRERKRPVRAPLLMSRPCRGRRTGNRQHCKGACCDGGRHEGARDIRRQVGA